MSLDGMPSSFRKSDEVAPCAKAEKLVAKQAVIIVNQIATSRNVLVDKKENEWSLILERQIKPDFPDTVAQFNRTDGPVCF